MSLLRNLRLLRRNLAAGSVRRWALPLLFVMAGLLLGGCAARQSGPAVTTLRWVVDPNPTRQDQIAGFEKTHPDIRINLDPDAGSQKILTQLAGGVYPDLFAVYDPATIRVFARKGVLMDLGPLMKKNGMSVSQFWPQLKPYMMHGGKVCGLPDNCGPFVVFYNRRLFREAGVPMPRPDWTWDDLLSAAKRLTRRDSRGRIVQFGIGYVDPWVMLPQWSARRYSPDGKRCLMDTPECRQAVRFWSSFRLQEHVSPSPTEEQSLSGLGGWGGAGNLFKAERVAMQVTGRWMCIEYRKNKGLDWDVAPVPQHGKVRATLLASKVYAIPKGCRHPEAAFAFLKYLVGRQDELLVASSGDGIPSVRKYAASREFLFNPSYPRERSNQVYLDGMEWARPPEMSPYISELDAMAIFNEEMDLMWQCRQTPDQACERIAWRTNAIIRRNISNPNLLD